ncbi:MAG: 23S rRNA (adenine(2503)-C(2))-methyltransferase RlmN [Clostridia bacterium]|nr:23S rRNA (adenine(2503)-C(2))-methyltransferase RlmN [Clostridia bacterium]
MTDIKSLTFEELSAALEAEGCESYRASQVFRWLYKDRVKDFSEMTNLSAALRSRLSELFFISKPEVLRAQVSSDGETAKLLYGLADGNAVETVFMKYKHGNTVCISTQAGCRMGCRFCASTKRGLKRNLTVSEMLDQIIFTEERFCDKISNIVLMGTGEPLDNFDNVVRFISMATDEKCLGLSIRGISLSTCGLVERIEQLRRMRLGLTLSVSLHAPNDEIRRRIMPVAAKYKIDDLLREVKAYADFTKRRVAIEYTLIKGVNDSDANARELAGRLRGIMAHVNLIPLNPSKECEWERPSPARINAFSEVLKHERISVTVRRELGTDIDAACGQLRLHYENEEKRGALERSDTLCGYTEQVT